MPLTFGSRLSTTLGSRLMMALLGISDDAARGQISRYRRRENLLQIFPRLRRSVEEANDGRFDSILGGSEGDSA